MTFAAIETRLNAAVLTHLANCTATLDGGAAFGGIYDNGSANALGGMVMGTKPTLTCAVADVGDSVRGKTLVVTYQSVVTSYTVAGEVSDGTGMVEMELEQA